MLNWFFLLMIPATLSFSQSLLTPLEKNNYQKLTSYTELVEFINELRKFHFFKPEVMGISVEGREIFAVKISKDEFASDTSKVKVFIFAQQHGNEQSGKEGSLFLLKNLAEGRLNHLIEKIDLLIVPQVNPDGSEKNKRRNANDADLNRNHLILTQPETIAQHKLFNQYLPEVTMDVHEYYPYSEEWKKFGYLKDFDEQIGTVTNPNASKKIKNYSEERFLPFIENYLDERGFSFHNYIVGGPPDSERIRFSTVDINDGRQSFAILNSFSFILEGKNGRDSIDNIKRRTEGQYEAMKGLLEFVYQNKEEIKNLVQSERAGLINSTNYDSVTVRMEHVRGNKPLQLNLKSGYTNTDTIVSVENFHPVVEPLLKIKKPYGYLIKKEAVELVNWMNKHAIDFYSYNRADEDIIESYFITKIDTITLEEMEIPDPEIKKVFKDKFNEEEYYFIPARQIHSNMLLLALEPQSMLGLIRYVEFGYLLKEGSEYPVLRVTR